MYATRRLCGEARLRYTVAYLPKEGMNRRESCVSQASEVPKCLQVPLGNVGEI